MKRGKSSFVGLLVSLSLALTPPTYARLDTGGASSALDNDSADSDVLYRMLSDVVFAGQHLSWLRVMNIAEDPVVSWGTVHDDYGNVLQSELWLIVVKNEKFIYFHLTDTLDPATNATAYGGYTVKIKAPMSVQFYGAGSGSIVPVIGNDTDTFLVTTTEMLVNSSFTEGEPQQLDVRTGAETPYLVHLYDMV